MGLTKQVADCSTGIVQTVQCDTNEAAAIQAEWTANIPTLGTYQQQQSTLLTNQLNNAIDAAFNHQTRDMFNWLYANAMATNMPNRAAYCQQLATWGQACLQALTVALAAVQAATTPADVQAVKLTIPTAPSITLPGAIALTN